jgi:hypothetical protein
MQVCHTGDPPPRGGPYRQKSGHKKPGLNKGSAGINSVPGLFSELFNVAASRPAQMTTERSKTSALSRRRQANGLINQARRLQSQANSPSFLFAFGLHPA